MDVAAENLNAFLFVRLQERRAGEADEHGARQDRLHRLVQLTRLRAVALVHEDIKVALGLEVRRKGFPDLFDITRDVPNSFAVLLPAELVNQRAEQPGRGGIQPGDEVRAALRPVDLFIDPKKDLLDLLVQFGAVGDDQHPGVLHVLANPLGQPHHDQALTAPLSVPDDAALAPLHMGLRCAHTEILIMPAQLLDAGVENDEIVDQLQKAGLGADPRERLVELVLAGALLLPGQVILFRRLDGAVAQSFGVVAGHDPLHGREEVPDEDLLLVVEVLPDALGHRHGGALDLQHAERDAVDVEHDIRALAECLRIGRRNGDFLGDGEVIVLRVLPVDKPDGLCVLAHAGLHLHAVAQQFIDGAIAVVEALARVAGGLVPRLGGVA